MRTDGSLPAAGPPSRPVVGHGGPRRTCARHRGDRARSAAALYAEYGGREGTEESISCDPQPDGSCSGLLERQAEREPRLVAKMNELGGILGLVGLVALLAGLLMLSVWRVTKARERNVERARPRRSSMWAEVLQPERAAPQRSQSMRSAPSSSAGVLPGPPSNTSLRSASKLVETAVATQYVIAERAEQAVGTTATQDRIRTTTAVEVIVKSPPRRKSFPSRPRMRPAPPSLGPGSRITSS